MNDNFVLVIAGWVKRTSMEEGWSLLPDIFDKKEHHGIHSVNLDFSLYQERPKDYDVVYAAKQK